MEYWQEHMLKKLVSYFEPKADVLGLLLFGSFSQPDYCPNDWSDLDVLVILQDGSLDMFFPRTEWISSFGNLYTYSQSSDGFQCTTRVCFENFHRLDFVITTEGRFAEIHRWSGVPFYAGGKVLFSRSRVVDEMVAQNYDKPAPRPLTSEQFDEMVRDFRFKSMLAVYKVVRGDLLIALHLAQDLIRDCCVLGMMLRDRTMGTNIHKQGGIGNPFVTQLEAARKPFTSLGILESIQESNAVFEKFACEWSSSYQENRQPLLDWIERAKVELH